LKVRKVIFLVNEFPALTETFILNQIIFLLRSGIDVRIFSFYRGNFNSLHQQYLGFGFEERLTVLGELPKSSRARFFEVWRFFQKSKLPKDIGIFLRCINPRRFGLSGLKLTYFLYYSKMAELVSCDLVHAHFGQMGVFFAKLKSAGLFDNLPYIVSFHGYDLVPAEGVENRSRYSDMFQTASLFTINSKYTGRLLHDIAPAFKEKVRLMPESLDTRLFDGGDRQISEGNGRSYQLVFVGRLVDWKGPDNAVRIAQILVNEFGFKDFTLSVIGKGPMLSALGDMVVSLGLSDHVKILGPQSQQQIRSILMRADLFIYTGREQEKTGRAENQGLVLMEAQAMGLPVVAFDVGGIGEGIVDQKTGNLVKSGALHEFAKQVVELLGDYRRRSEMGKSARDFVSEKFDIEVLGKRLLELYEEVLT
jgi:colanic acid/amylovoran biosynthesis glycosyltransferase